MYVMPLIQGNNFAAYVQGAPLGKVTSKWGINQSELHIWCPAQYHRHQHWYAFAHYI